MLKVALSNKYAHTLPTGHRFPMEKYELLPGQLLYEGTLRKENFFEPEPLDFRWILQIHDKAYVEKLVNLALSPSEIRKTGFPLSKELVEREIQIVGGSVEAALYALEYGIAMNIAGGTHHAFTDRGEGFCLLNDIAIAANYLIQNGKARQVLVVDLDVHQGNGTAQIFCDATQVFTLSMHGASNYPLHKEKSHLDIPLQDGIKDREYLTILKDNLVSVVNRIKPDFIIFQSGVDVLQTDKLGRLGLTLQGCKERDRVVLELAFERKIPIICCMGGGYSTKISTIIEAHANTYRLAQEIFF